MAKHFDEQQTQGLHEELKAIGLPVTEDELSFILYLMRKSGRSDWVKREYKDNDYIEYRVELNDGPTLGIRGFEATLEHVPPLAHGVYGDIDTLALEHQMNTISWQIPAQNQKLLPEVFGKIMSIYQTKSKEGIAVVEGLQFKYWNNSLVGEFVDVDRFRDKFRKSHYFKINNNVGDITTGQAYNLLCGRAIMKFEEGPPRHFYPFWACLEKSQDQNHPEALQLVKYPAFELKKLLEGQPFEELQPEDRKMYLFRSLIEGNLTDASVIAGQKRIPVQLSVEASKGELIVRDLYGQVVSLNALLGKKEKAKVNNNPTPNRPVTGRQQAGKRKGRSI